MFEIAHMIRRKTLCDDAELISSLIILKIYVSCIQKF